MSDGKFMLLQGDNISELSEQQLAKDNQMLLYGSEREFFLKHQAND